MHVVPEPQEGSMHGKAPAIIIAVSLAAMMPLGASATPLVGDAGLTGAAETLAPVENVHYYGRGYYGRGYYGRGYGYGRGYYGYGRGYYGYGRGYYGGYGRGYRGYRYY
jgi:hypothetical protein